MTMVLWGNLAWHPAAAAWREVAPDAPSPETIEVLHRKSGTGVYRLIGADPGGAPIIARRSGRVKAVVVRAIYEKLLSRLPIAASRYRAFRADGRGFAWVFLEEASKGSGRAE